MNSVQAEELEFNRVIAGIPVVFAVVTVASNVTDKAIALLVGLGWFVPVFLFVVAVLESVIMVQHLLIGRTEERLPQELIAASMAALGTQILFLTTCWGWAKFGLGRLAGEPSLEETVLTICFLVGGSGLLLSQRWAAVLVCGTGWWWLAHLLWMRITSPVAPGITVALSLAALVLPLTVMVAASWRCLKNWR
jgi:hypothetical protein